MSGNTVFISYLLIPTGITGGSYSQAIHCNYFKKIDLGGADPYIQEISLNFPKADISDFKFLASTYSDSTGYTVNEIHALVQIVSNAPFDSYGEVVPSSTGWTQFNMTYQIPNYASISGASFVLTPTLITDVVFKISLLHYPDNPVTTFLPYDLEYISYPSTDDRLAFGEATYFFGNVATEIKADVYTTDISIPLPQAQFNSTTNLTWDGLETVYISEIGIYDSNKNLVAIGKLNDPVAKNPSIGRTIVFALDF